MSIGELKIKTHNHSLAANHTICGIACLNRSRLRRHGQVCSKGRHLLGEMVARCLVVQRVGALRQAIRDAESPS